MTKRKSFLVLSSIILLAFLAGNLSYPAPLNRGIDFLNAQIKLWEQNPKLKIIAEKIKIRHFIDLPFKLGLDLQGGTHLLYQADLNNIAAADQKNALAGLRDVIERRINLFGVREPVVQIEEKSQRLIVELAGISDVQEAIKMIGQTPFLEFREPRPEEQTNLILAKQKELEGKTYEEAQQVPDWQIALEDPYFMSTQLTGRYLKKADLAFDQTTNKPQVSIQFNEEGAKLFEELTTKNVGQPLAIYIDNALLSRPVVQEAIKGGQAQITGDFTVEAGRDLARNLNAGALPVPIKLVSQETIGPILGQASLEKSLKAGFIGFALVFVFMILFYRLPGFLASLALAIYVALLLSLFKLIPVTLTLAGIAGLILSVGMAVDANILIFARMREELKQGKSLTLAVEEGFKRAWPSIRDSNANSIIVTLILFGFGVGFVKGFALTLMIGIILSLFSAIFMTRNFLRLVENTVFAKIKWLW
ncbi:MAG: protein-export membrane protein SecD [Candidatus Wildermuthbacteria bacterium GWA2_46_15]|uniref:Protein translocase subunit SecD n=1 Tax=Candidatus Wildermuthbacteria bacterium GWA2_46_15 TaxID=1802443 RepID=A0A1G2QQ19_9BACT|nr:MAG: protein-export membrane protein SecD [Candidatus Wildermuthbacteria bacterium GWA2_46_15]